MGTGDRLPQFELREARYSTESLISSLIVYIDYRNLGTYEPPTAAKTRAAHEAITRDGYKGPAIAAYFPFDDTPMYSLNPGDYLDVPYGVIGIADGHNRHEVVRRLDTQRRLRSPIIPIQLVPAHNLDIVRAWEGGAPHPEKFGEMCTRCLAKFALIQECYADPEQLTEANTMCFTGKLKDGVGAKIASAQPDVVIARDELLRW